MADDALKWAAARDDEEIAAAGVVALLHARFELEQIVAILADQRHLLTAVDSRTNPASTAGTAQHDLDLVSG